MTFHMDQLPPDVIQALEQGKPIEAIKRLRKHTNVGLAEAKALIDAQLQGRKSSSSFDQAHRNHPSDDAGRVLPADVAAALLRGNKGEAIKLLRARTGVGLAEAKTRVEAAHAGGGHVFTPPDEGEAPRLQPPPPPTRSGLAPGEVQQSNAAFWVVVFLVAVLIAYYVFGRS